MRPQSGGLRLCLILVFAIAFAGLPAAAADFPFQQFVVFGDSLSDTGNDALATGGVIPGNNYSGGRFTDGPDTTPSSNISGVWHEQLAGKLGIAPASTPYLAGGSNYAFGGASTGSGTVPPGMQNQVGLFLAGKTSVPANSLYVFWGGADDLLNASTASGVTAAATQAVTSISQQIGALYTEGARNFLWVNLPPLDQTPTGKASPLSAALGQGSVLFDQAWLAAVQQLDSQFSGISVTGVDVYSLFISLLENPAPYGLTNVTDTSQGVTGVNPDTYLFWDSLHPTTAGHALVADLAARDLDAAFSPEPASISLMLGGVLTLGILRLRRSRRQSPDA